MTHDVIIVGSGAGGSAAAYVLAHAGLHVLLIERGPKLPRDGSTLDVNTVFKEGRFLAKEPWLDRHGAVFTPQERFNLGGKTKWYGAALIRFARHEFQADAEHGCRGWPLDYDAIAPYYERVEQLMGVRHFPIEPELHDIVINLQRHNIDWRAEPLSVGLMPEVLEHDQEARHFDGFASPRGLKADGEVSLLERARHLPNLTVLTDTRVAGLLPQPLNARAVGGILTDTGEVIRARTVLLAAGALHSPRLLRSYVDQAGLGAELEGSAAIGRHYKFHVLTAMLAFSFARKTDALRKTTLILNDALPHSSVQPLGCIDGDQFAAEAPGFVPHTVSRFIGERVYGFFLQTEDGSHRDNRIVGAIGERGRLDYDLARVPAARDEHTVLVRTLRRDLIRSGFIPLTKAIPIDGTAHACGTLVAGNDPKDSVVDGNGLVHGMENLYVVDGSVLPRSSRANPALTIYAWAMRVADRLSGGKLLARDQAAAPARHAIQTKEKIQ